MRVKNWRKFQHFKDRKPPWIKLYRDLLDDLEWHELDAEASKALVMIWLIASEDHGELPDTKRLAFRLRLSQKETISVVKRLSHWLEQDDIKAISDRHQDDLPETETETETETEEETEDSAEPQSDSTPSVIEIPLIGKEAFSVTQQQLDEWQATYGAVNVLQQLKEMREWCLANPARKKTRNGVRGFIIRWLGKEQDKDHRRIDGRTEKQKEVDQTMDFLLGRTQPTAKPLTHDPDPWDII